MLKINKNITKKKTISLGIKIKGILKIKRIFKENE
jgi:hypothetical protein